MTEHHVSRITCGQNGCIFIDDNMYGALYISDYEVSVTQRRTKQLTVHSVTGDTFILESGPRGLLGGYGPVGTAIDEFVAKYPSMRKIEEEAEKRRNEYEKFLDDHTYGFLIADVRGLGPLFTESDFEKIFGYNVQRDRVLMFPCGIRGQRMLMLYHADPVKFDIVKDIVRLTYKDKIIQEGPLSVCVIDHNKPKLVEWKFEEKSD